jgi:hypothetical protein
LVGYRTPTLVRVTKSIEQNSIYYSKTAIIISVSFPIHATLLIPLPFSIPETIPVFVSYPVHVSFFNPKSSLTITICLYDHASLLVLCITAQKLDIVVAVTISKQLDFTAAATIVIEPELDLGKSSGRNHGYQ